MKQRLLYAAETVRYGSGKVAYKQGSKVLVVLGGNGTTYVYDATLESVDPARGIGLLYTHGPEVPVHLDNKSITSGFGPECAGKVGCERFYFHVRLQAGHRAQPVQRP